MAPRPTDLLTEQQKVVLRHVLKGDGSKTIARALGLSPHTIDGHARDAIRTLGVGDRKKAAKLLAEAERTAPQALSDQPLRIPDPEPPALATLPSAPGHPGNDRWGEDQVMEERIPPPWPERPKPGRQAEGRRNNLGAGERLVRIGRTAVAVVSAFATIAFAMFLLQRLFQALSFPAQ